MSAREPIPVVLFAYARPEHLARTLTSLRENRVPLLYVFADGPKPDGNPEGVRAARASLKAIDWCEVRLVERRQNMGLGRNVMAGVTDVAARHDAFIVWEDDLVAVNGTYAWLCAALRHYADDPRVMSVTGWTHPRVTPATNRGLPYFDGRAESWTWGTWSRSWRGMMEQTAREKLQAMRTHGVADDVYGSDVPEMARDELAKNIWAVRWVCHHLQHGGLCLRPPWSMVDHIGFDANATNAAFATGWTNPSLRSAPPVPVAWPEPEESLACRKLWRQATGLGRWGRPGKLLRGGWHRVRKALGF